MSKPVVLGIICSIGILCIIGGSIFLGLFPGIIRDKINEEIPLRIHSDSYKRWKELEVPVYMKFWIFDLGNQSLPLKSNWSELNLKEIGPYVYEEKRIKEKISFSDNEKNESVVAFNERKIYKFRKDLSNGLSESDSHTFINIPILGLMFNKLNSFASSIFKGVLESDNENITVNEKSLFTKREVRELLFNGFELYFFKKINSVLPTLIGTKFSIFDGYNYLENQWVVHTGIDNIDKLGEIYNYNGQRTLKNVGHLDIETLSNVWTFHKPNQTANETSCNSLKGTDGTMFPPIHNTNEYIYAFEPQLCRTVYFKYEKETTVKDIPVYRYWVPEEYHQSPLINHKHDCYCLSDNPQKDCKYNGVLDISHCEEKSIGAPVIISSPYFLHGSQYIRDKIGLKPKMDLNDNNYGTFLDIEPSTGTVLRAVRRIQINAKLTQYLDNNYMPELKNLVKNENFTEEVVVPLLWLEETAEADDKQADEFKSMVTNKKKLGNGLAIAVLVIGFIIVITCLALYIRHRKSLVRSFHSENNNRDYKTNY